MHWRGLRQAFGGGTHKVASDHQNSEILIEGSQEGAPNCAPLSCRLKAHTMA